MLTTRQILAAVAASLPACLAQTSTTCNPLDTSCSPDPALSSSTFSSSWTSSSSLGDGWSTAAGTVAFGSNGAQFIIKEAGDAPTIQTDFYIFFGSVEVTMQAAAGTGIVSSIVLLSDVLDEVDWEFTGGDTTQTQTNYFGKGNTTTYDRAIWYPVSSPQTTSHTYTIDWTSESITWAIDGTVVRTLAYADANGGDNFPQTPMRVRIGNWAGGAPGNPEGTIEWAGGETDFSQGPFTMSVSSVKITNYSPGSEYVYKGNSGSYESIEVVKGDGSSGTAGVFAPSPTSSSASASASTSETTTAAGTTITQSTTSVASSIKASTASSGAQLSTIPLQVSSTTSAKSSSVKSSSTESSSTKSSSTEASSASSTASSSSTQSSAASPTTSASSTASSGNSTSAARPSASITQVDSSGATTLHHGGSALVALVLLGGTVLSMF